MKSVGIFEEVLHHKPLRNSHLVQNIFLEVPLDWLLLCLLWPCEHVNDSSVSITTNQSAWKTEVSSYHLELTNKICCYIYLQQKQEIWLAVYSRSNLIGVAYLHLSLTRSLAHSLGNTGKYENRGAPIPVEGRMCLVCNRGYIEDERHFLMYCPGYDNIRNELHSLLSTHDVVFKTSNEEDKIRYFLTLENQTTSKIVGKYTYLMFQKRKDILNSKYN